MKNPWNIRSIWSGLITGLHLHCCSLLTESFRAADYVPTGETTSLQEGSLASQTEREMELAKNTCAWHGWALFAFWSYHYASVKHQKKCCNLGFLSLTAWIETWATDVSYVPCRLPLFTDQLPLCYVFLQGFDQMIEASKLGLPVDLSQVSVCT